MLTANDDVNGALDAMLCQQLRNLKSGLRGDIFGDDRLARSQSISGRRTFESGDGRLTNNAGVPVHPSSHQHCLMVREKLKHFYEIDVYCIGNELRGLLQQRANVINLQRKFAEVG
jgi:hypothetical protein